MIQIYMHLILVLLGTLVTVSYGLEDTGLLLAAGAFTLAIGNTSSSNRSMFQMPLGSKMEDISWIVDDLGDIARVLFAIPFGDGYLVGGQNLSPLPNHHDVVVWSPTTGFSPLSCGSLEFHPEMVPTVYDALVSDNNDVIVAGTFGNATQGPIGVAVCYDSATSWSFLGEREAWLEYDMNSKGGGRVICNTSHLPIGFEFIVGGRKQFQSSRDGVVQGWNGTHWSTYPVCSSAAVNAMVIFRGYAFVGGSLSNCGGVSIGYTYSSVFYGGVGRLDLVTGAWSALGSTDYPQLFVYDFLVDELSGFLFVGMGDQLENEPSGFAVWNEDTQEWFREFEVAGDVRAMCHISADEIVLGGSFTEMNGERVSRLLWLNTTTMTTIHPALGVGGTVETLVVHNNKLIVGGSGLSYHPDQLPVINIVTYNMNSQTIGNSTLESVGFPRQVPDFCQHDDAYTLYCAGARVGSVTSIAQSNTSFCIGGMFMSIGALYSSSVACFDGEWERGPTGGLGGDVFVMELIGSSLLIGGRFQFDRQFGSKYNLVMWEDIRLGDQSPFLELGGGLDGPVTSLLYRPDKGDVIIGGSFEKSADQSVFNPLVARLPWGATTLFAFPASGPHLPSGYTVSALADLPDVGVIAAMGSESNLWRSPDYPAPSISMYVYNESDTLGWVPFARVDMEESGCVGDGSAQVHSMLVINQTLYIGGAFSFIGMGSGCTTLAASGFAWFTEGVWHNASIRLYEVMSLNLRGDHIIMIGTRDGRILQMDARTKEMEAEHIRMDGPVLSTAIITLCQAGFYVDHGNCVLCPLRTYCGQPGGCLGSCSPCPDGLVALEEGLDKCVPCPSGEIEKAGECVPCEAGEEWNNGVCVPCLVGHEHAGGGILPCLPCGRGFFADQNRTEQCKPCLPGHHAPNEGSSTCEMCKGGTYSPGEGGVDCVPCPGGGISNDGASECIACPELSIAPPGSSTPSDCQCVAGAHQKRFDDDGGPLCEDCPVGGVCKGSGVPAVPQPGFWGDGDFQVCPGGTDACLGGEILGGCAVGYEGRLCSKCSSKYYLSRHKCYACDQGNELRISMFFLAVLCICMFSFAVAIRSGSTPRFIALSLGLHFLQSVAMNSLILLGWPPLILATFNFFDVIANIDLGAIIAPECSGVTSFATTWLLKSIIPWFCSLVFIVLYGVAYYSLNRFGPKPAWLFPHRLFAGVRGGKQLARASGRAFLFLLMLAFMPLAKTSFQFFACQQTPLGNYVLMSSPDDECYGEWWIKLLPLAIISLVLYVITLPLVMAYVLWRSRKNNDEATFVEKYGVLVAPFYRRWWFHMLIIKLRQVAYLVAIFFLSSNAYFQAAAVQVVSFVASILQALTSPFVLKRHNVLELGTQITNFFIVYVGSLGYVGEALQGSDTLSFVVSAWIQMIIIIVMLFVILVVFLMDLNMLRKDPYIWEPKGQGGSKEGKLFRRSLSVRIKDKEEEEEVEDVMFSDISVVG